MTEVDPAFRARVTALRNSRAAGARAEARVDRMHQQAVEAETKAKRELLRRVIPIAGRVAAAARDNVQADVTLSVDKGIVHHKTIFGRVKRADLPPSPNPIRGWKLARYQTHPFKTIIKGDEVNDQAIAGPRYYGTIMLTTAGQLVTYRTGLVVAVSPAYLVKKAIPTNAYAEQERPFQAHTLRDLATLGDVTDERYATGNIHFITSGDQYPLPLFAEPEVIEQGLAEFVLAHELEV